MVHVERLTLKVPVWIDLAEQKNVQRKIEKQLYLQKMAELCLEEGQIKGLLNFHHL